MRNLRGGASQTWRIDHNGVHRRDEGENGLSPLPNANDANKNTSNFRKFKLLLWKNWTIQKRHPGQICLEIFLPVFCSIILIFTRHYTPADLISERTEFMPFSINTAPYETVRNLCDEIYYAPKNPATDKLMTTIRDNYFIFGPKKYKVTGFDTEEKLVESYKEVSLALHDVSKLGNVSLFEDPVTPVLAGVIFTNKFEENGKSFPGEIKYSLRFPAKQRSEFDLITERFGLKPAWYTDLIYAFLKLPGPRAKLADNGGLPGYYAEGFLYLQYAIETTLTKSVLSNDTEELAEYMNYDIQLQRFPYPPYREDKFLFTMQAFLPILIMLSLIYPVLNITRSIVLEKEKRLKESMKMMGLSNYLHWAAWIVKSFTFLLVALIIMTVILTIPFTNDIAVIHYSNPFVLFIIMLVFAIQAVAMAFLASTLTNNANIGAVFAAVLWFIAFAPFTLLEPRFYILSRTEKSLFSLFTNAPIGLACFIICAFEVEGTGLQWGNMFSGVGPADNFNIGDCIYLILFNSAVFFLLALYIESVWPGEYGIPLPWNYPFKKWYWTNGTRDAPNQQLNPNRNSTPEHLMESEPNRYAGIKLKGLSKDFGGKAAVQNLHLNMFENQITALLGHNGAGKSTTISMLTGLYPPTSGTALIHDFDIGTEVNSVRSSLGICPQHDVLFDELTVQEHLEFFCLLKGFPEEIIPFEIDRTLKALGFEEKRNAQAHTLSGGMKRKLSVSVAFCGGSKVVLLDEPTSGMDPSARRSCWDLIQNLKKGRTILLSTHFMEEADLLGDRIAIMADGELQCCGSSLFLKKKYGGGYHLIIVKDEDCNTDNITNLLKQRIPNIEIEQNVGAELSYSLPDEKSLLFPEMFEELETRKTELGIASYGASITTMEEVFIRVGREAEKKVTERMEKEHQNSNDSSSNSNGGSTTASNNAFVGVSLGSFLDVNSNSNLYEQSRRNTGFSLFCQQFRAMIVKKLIYIVRNRILLFVQLGVPIICLLVLLLLAPSFPGLGQAPPLKMTLDSYENFGSIINTVHCENPSQVCEAFKDTITSDGYKLQDTRNESVLEFISAKQLIDITYTNYRYIIAYEEAVSNESDTIRITSWFNNEQPHTPPLAYNLVTNSILKAFDKNVTLTVTNSPFPYTSLESGKQAGSFYTLGFLVGYNMVFGTTFLASSFIVFLIVERESRSKHLQFIAGVKYYVFWLANYMIDFTCFMITCFISIIIIQIFKVEEYTSPQMISNMIILFAVYGIGILPFIYLWSFAFTESTSGFIRTAMFNLFTGKIAMIVYAIITIVDFKLEVLGDKLNDAFMMFPTFAFGNGMVQMAKNLLLKDQCTSFFSSPESYEINCQVFENNICCKTVKDDFFDWEVNGIGKNILSLITLGTCCMIILMIYESKIWKFCQCKTRRSKPTTVKNELDELIVEDQDVAEERERISTTPLDKLNETDNLVLRDLTKYYGKFCAVDKLNLGVQRGQTFGLLGVNGAGKTTTFKMLTGDYSCTSGDAFIYSHSIRNDIKGVHQNMGYCPQFDGLIGEMTGRETLRMFGRLRGIWETDIDTMINKIAQDLIFTQHLDKLVKNYSGGNKRKLSTAMAFVGNPPIVFLDEPSTGMDPVARRHLWNAISIVRERGTSVVLTSHSLEECEALCSRLAIMVNGVFRCLGSPQHLKNKFSEGYTIIAQCAPTGVGNDYSREKQETALRRSSSLFLRKTTAPQKWEQALDGLRNFIDESFPGATLKDIHPGFIHYHISPSQGVTWGKLFEKMEIAKEKFSLDAYSVGQTSLEQVFLNFAKSQVNIE